MTNFFLLTGMLWAGVANILFGCVDFISDPFQFFFWSSACKIVDGVGSTFVQSTAITILSRIYPDKAAAMATVLQISFGLGILMGPFGGNFFYETLSSYKAPFVVCGATELLILIPTIFFSPYKPGPLSDYISATRKKSSLKFLKFVFKPKILLFVIPEMLVFSAIGYKDTVLAEYLEKRLKMTDDKIAYMFIPFSVSYVLAAPVLGFLTRKGLGSLILLVGEAICSIFCFINFLFLIIPSLENLYVIISTQILFGFSVASIFNPHYLVIEKIASKEGFRDIEEVKTLGALSFGLITNSSISIGSFLFGGYFFDKFGYYYTFLIYGILLAISTVWEFGFMYRHKLLKKLYYAANRVDLEESISIRQILTRQVMD